jgi:short-subunit dehydrogenase involved in D-alanine esterification of teichoic acids
MQLDGSVALVSGGASGLGRATAEALDRAGADVVVLYLPDAADQLDRDRFTFAPADVRDEDAVTAAVAVATERGPLRVTVNCAGIGPPARVVRKGEPMALEQFTTTIELLGSLPPAARESLGHAVPHPARLGDPTEYAALVLHVIDNPMLNGEVIRLDGALRMGPR